MEKYPGIAKRIYDEGHEIGNHTFTHPDISNISKRYFEVELNLTERLFEGKLGVKPVLFRPPYSIDQEPDTADQVRPLELSQDMGFITVGDKIDPNDWRDNPRRYGAGDRGRCVGQPAALRSPAICAAATSSCCTMAAAIAARRSKALGMMLDGLHAARLPDCAGLASCWARRAPTSCRPFRPTSAGPPGSTA